MSRIQGHFTHKDVAEKARQTLIGAGVSARCIHIWNNISDSAPFRASRDTAAGGALLGGALAGAVGLAAGAAIGDSLDESRSAPRALTNVRLVVDHSEMFNSIDIEVILRECGATSINYSD